MQVLYSRCAGFDVHKDSVMVCLLIDRSEPIIRNFGTTTQQLLLLRDFLVKHRIKHIAMESTGVYWKPIWNILEDGLELMLVNAQHIKQVPGRKTDVQDCQWIADLLRHGLRRSCNRPETSTRPSAAHPALGPTPATTRLHRRPDPCRIGAFRAAHQGDENARPARGNIFICGKRALLRTKAQRVSYGAARSQIVPWRWGIVSLLRARLIY